MNDDCLACSGSGTLPYGDGNSHPAFIRCSTCNGTGKLVEALTGLLEKEETE